MMIGRYRLLSQVGAGRDGVTYRALAAGDDGPIELRVLSAARANAERWHWLVRRLRLVGMLAHPAALRLADVALDHDPPYIAVEPTEPHEAADEPSTFAPLPVAEAVSLASTLADLLGEAHRLGLVHGQI